MQYCVFNIYMASLRFTFRVRADHFIILYMTISRVYTSYTPQTDPSSHALPSTYAVQIVHDYKKEEKKK